HDTISGCTADSVAAGAGHRLDVVAAYAAELTRRPLMDLVGHDPDLQRERTDGPEPALVLWNPAPRARAGVTVADVSVFRRDVLVGPPADGRLPRQGAGYRPFALYDRDGRPLPVQVLAQRRTQERIDATRHYPDQDEVDQVRIAFRAPPVPGLGLAALTAGTAVPLARSEDVRVRGRCVRHGRAVGGARRSGGVSAGDSGAHRARASIRGRGPRRTWPRRAGARVLRIRVDRERRFARDAAPRGR